MVIKENSKIKTKGGPDALDVVIGRNLVEVRTLRGMSQEGLACEVGVTFQQIQKYEKGHNRIAASRLLRIANALEVNIDIFYKGLLGDPCEKTVFDTNVLKIAEKINRIDNKEQLKTINMLIKALSGE